MSIILNFLLKFKKKHEVFWFIYKNIQMNCAVSHLNFNVLNNTVEESVWQVICRFFSSVRLVDRLYFNYFNRTLKKRALCLSFAIRSSLICLSKKIAVDLRSPSPLVKISLWCFPSFDIINTFDDFSPTTYTFPTLSTVMPSGGVKSDCF